MELHFDDRIKKILKRYSLKEQARIDKVRELFEERGFDLTEKHLKKLTNNLWELRVGAIRLIFGVLGKDAVVVNSFKKKTQKTPIKDLHLSEKRFNEYL